MKIASPVLRKALRELVDSQLTKADLARPKKLDLSKEELARTLDADDLTVNDLKGIEACTGLTELNLADHAIKDVKPLAALHKLKKLYLQYNAKLRDISPLASLTKLQVLYLVGTKVRDLDALRNLQALQLVSLSETPISDITVLEGLEKLSNVVLRDCKKLVVEEGNATYQTITTLIDRGVDVYIDDHPLIEAYKKRGKRGKPEKKPARKKTSSQERALAKRIKDSVNDVCPDCFDVGLKVSSTEVSLGQETKVRFDFTFTTYEGEQVKERIWVECPKAAIAGKQGPRGTFIEEVVDELGAVVDEYRT
jgi:hypothetical protein